MTKVALCIRSNADLQKLISGEVETIQTFMVPRSICETHSETAPLKQLIPYVTFSALSDEGTLMFMAYNRPKGGSEERLHGDTSIGFGGHMDDLQDLVFTSQSEQEAYPGMAYPCYEMTKEQVIRTIYNTARREVLEELNDDVFDKIGLTVEHINMTIMEDPEPDDVGKVHTCISIVIDLPAEALVGMKDVLLGLQTEETKREIINLRVFGVLMESLSKGDLVESMKGLENTLVKDHSFERWSLRILLTRALMVMNFVYSNTTFTDFFNAAITNVQTKLELQKQQEAAAAAESGLAQSNVLTGEAVNDAAPQVADTGVEEASAQG